jgi:DNA-binding response OmpR family regulator
VGVRIILFGENDYLLGLLKGYCLFIDCEVKAIGDCDSFLNDINNNPPTVIFIELAKAPHLFGMTEWPATLRFIKEKQIAVCSFGEPPLGNEGIKTIYAFDKNFSTPLSVDEMQAFLLERFGLNDRKEKEERRYLERRKEENRRKFIQMLEMRDVTDETTGNSSYAQQNTTDNVNIGPLLINYSHKIISVNDIKVDLSPKEFAIISVLASHSGCVVKVEDILKKVWSDDERATKSDVYQYMHMLRKKIEIDPTKPQLIVTVKGCGYELSLDN